MSQSIEERVVKMQFDNSNFQKNVSSSIESLDSLKKTINSTGSVSGFESMASAVENISDKFNGLSVVGATVISNLTNTAVNAAKSMVSKVTSIVTDGIMQGGYARAANIEKAKFMLSGLGVTWDQISDDIMYAVDRTAYGLDAAANVAAQLVASGTQIGDQMKGSLRAISGVAAMTNSSYEEIGAIFTTAAGQGKIMTMQLRQLEARGLNAAATLGKALNKSEAEIRDMVTNGQIDFETFAAAMDDAFGEHAKDANKTLTGVLSNIKSALAKIGADFFQPIIANEGPLVEMLDTVREKINEVRTAVTGITEGNVDWVTDWLNDFSSFIKEIDVTPIAKFYEICSNLVRMVSSWNTQIGKAFDEIFPNGLGININNISDSLLGLIKSLTLTADSVQDADGKLQILENGKKEKIDGIKSAFAGLFAILDIGKQALSALLAPIKTLIGHLTGVDVTIAQTAGSFGDFFVSLDKAVKDSGVFVKIGEFLSGIVDALFMAGDAFVNSGVIQAFKDFFSAISKGLSEVDIPGFSNVCIELEGAMTPLQFVAALVGSAFTVMLNTITNIVPVFQKAGAKIKEVCSSIAEGIKELFNSGNLGTALTSAIGFIGMTSVFDSLKSVFYQIRSIAKILAPGGGILDTIESIRSSISDMTTSMLKNSEGDKLLKIAAAMLVLAIAMTKLASIDTAKLGEVTVVVSALFGELMLAMKYLQKMTFDKSLGSSSTALIKMSVAVLILATAMEKLAELDPAGLVKGIVGVTFMLGELTAVAIALSKFGGSMIKGSSGLILMAIALRMLVEPIATLGALPTDQLITGMLSVLTLLTALTIVSQLMKPSLLLSTGLGLLAVAGAVKVLGESAEVFGQMEWGELAKAGVAIGALLTALTLVSKFAGSGLKLVGLGLGMIEIGAAMNLFAISAKSFGNIPVEGLLKAGAAMLSISIILSAFSETVRPVKLIAASTGMIIFGAALALFAADAAIISAISWEGLAKAGMTLLGLSTIIGVFTASVNPVSLIASSAGLLVMAAALTLFVPALLTLGSMSVGSVITSLLTLAGVFAVIGGAAVILTPVIPLMLALGVALALVGVGSIAIGAGLNLLGAGLVSLGIGIASLAASLGVGVVGIIASLGEAVVSVAESLNRIFQVVLQIIIENAPLIAEGVIAIITAILDELTVCLPQIVEKVATTVVNVLDLLIEYLPQIVSKVIDMITSVIDAIAEKIPDIIDSAINLIVNFIEGLALGIENNKEKIKQAVDDLCTAMWDCFCEFWGIHSPSTEAASLGGYIIEGLANGLNAVDKVKEAVGNIATNIKNKFTENNEKLKNTGTNIVENIQNGVNSSKAKLENAVSTMVSGAKAKITSFESDFKSAGVFLMQGFKNGIESMRQTVINAASAIASAALAILNSVLRIASPSKATFQTGRFFDLGFANGIKKYAYKAVDASETLAEDSMNGFNKKLQAVRNLGLDDDFFNPVITPVLDLSNVKEGSSTLSSMLSSISSTSIKASRTGIMTSGIAGTIGNSINGSFGGTVVNNYNTEFNQTNNSPKALSRSEIYRQTKNQIRMIKGVALS